ncbi:MAG: OmpA family protein [Bdellovibrionales bacterium]
MSYSWQDKADAPSHADDWLITYADLITLLLCFFVLFLVISISKEKKLSQEISQKAITEAIAPSSPLVIPDDLPLIRTEEPDEPAVPAPPPLPPVSEPKGDRITILEMNSAAFFDIGSAILNPAGKALLQGVADKLKGVEFKDYRITVEGHTDDTPINTAQFPSNWELSTARASAVVRHLVEQGIGAEKLRAAGYADTFPKVPNRDEDGKAISFNQAENRRVIIKLEKIEKAQ